MSFGTVLFTNKGKVLQAKAESGIQLQFTKLSIGKGELGETPISELVGLIDPVIDINITELSSVNGYAKVGGIFKNEGLLEGFYWRELALFANDPDEGEILYCYGNAGELAEYIPPESGSEILEKYVRIAALIGNATNITANIDSSLVYATQNDLNNKFDEVSMRVDDLIQKIDEPLYQTILSANEILDLPMETIKGQVNVVLGDNTYTNLITNGNFSNNTTGWIAQRTILSASNNLLQISATADTGPHYAQQIISTKPSVGKYYFSTQISEIVGGVSVSLFNQKSDGSYDSVTTSASLNSNKHSGILSITSVYSTPTFYLRFNLLDSSLNATFSGTNETIKASSAMVINLTQIFGEGNEPTKEQCDKMFPNWFDGTKSTLSTRLKSVGKNLFDGELELGNLNLTTGEDSDSSIIHRSKNFINVKPNQNYIFSSNGTLLNDIRYILEYDINKNFIRWVDGGSFTTSTQTAYIKFRGETNEVKLSSNIQLEEGTTATTYEPYKESIAYYPEIGESLPNGVKEEINADGEYVQRIDKAIFDGDENFSVTYNSIYDVYIYKITDWAIANNSLEVINQVDNTKAGFAFNSENSNIAISTSSDSSTWEHGNFVIGVTSGNLFLRIKGSKGITTVTELNTYLSTNPITLTYQLAEPIVTEIFTTPLIGYPNGTVIEEHIIGEYGYYDSAKGATVSNSSYPIKELDYIKVVDEATGDMTELDVSQATIAVDGLSWTHPSLSGSEMVDWDYYYTNESTYSQKEITVATNLIAALLSLIKATEDNSKYIQMLHQIISTLKAKIQDYSLYRSGKDSNSKFTVIEYKRPDGTLALKSTISGTQDADGNYPTRTEEYYNLDGTTIFATISYTRTFDSDGDLVSEVIG
ncbi:MAG: hypothetical protein FH761_17930 [Firmicutes bacterium]|nr:hypothetical protein [Bacillota bacterium]